MTRWNDSAVIERLLRTRGTWAVVGCSDDPRRPSYGVARFLAGIGCNVICINPHHDSCLEGLPCYASLEDVPDAVDVVDLFRRPDAVGPHVEEAIAIGAKAVWMQLGVVNEPAALRAAQAGLDVVMDRCPKIEFRPEFLAPAP